MTGSSEKDGLDLLALGGRLGGIEKGIEIIAQTLREDRLSSAQYRTDVRREIGALNDKVDANNADIRSLTETMTEIRPKVNQLEAAALLDQGHDQSHGRIMGVFAKMGYALLGAIGSGIVVAIEHSLGRK